MQNFHLSDNLIKKKILVVEDDEISFLVLSEYLKQDNYKVVRAVNGEEAVSLIQNDKDGFGLVLMDILMPIMNGFEAAKNIKKINKSIPVIAQTAVDYSRNNEADFSNFNKVLLKPLNFKKLKELIRSVYKKNNVLRIIEPQMN